MSALADIKLAHTYAQLMWHTEAVTVANRAALLAMRAAIDRALSEGVGSASLSVTDGEGYDHLFVCNDRGWEHPSWIALQTPYTHEAAGDHRTDRTDPFDIRQLVEREGIS